MLVGLASSTYSTLVSKMAASRLGRDPRVDWMSVAAIPARGWALQFDPGLGSNSRGDSVSPMGRFFLGAAFGVFGRWTASACSLGSARLAMGRGDLFLEWLLLVPVFPFAQPIFTPQQPYWIGFLVHLSSALLYPGFAWIRWSRAQRRRLFGGDTFSGRGRLASLGCSLRLPS